MVDFGDASGGGQAPFTSSPGSFSTMVDFGRRSREGAYPRVLDLILNPLDH